MKRALRRIGIGLGAVVALLVVARAIVVPLAMQRQGRQDETLNILALIPADARTWTLRRNFFRRLQPGLLPRGRETLELNLQEYDLPLETVKGALSVERCWGGEWLGGETADGGWFLAATLGRIPRENPLGAALLQRPDTLIAIEEGFLTARGHFVLAVSDTALLAREPWLATLTPWDERDQLLLTGDLLEFRAAGGGGLLTGTKSVQRSVSCEGLAWEVEEGVERLSEMAPGPRAEREAAAAELDALPLLRRGAPFTPAGDRMSPAGLRLTRRDDVIVGERRWRGGRCAALARIIIDPAD